MLNLIKTIIGIAFDIVRTNLTIVLLFFGVMLLFYIILHYNQ